jgi:hypothetical protein
MEEKYKLIKRVNKNQNEIFNIKIKVDSNDADYMYSNFECDKNAFEDIFVYLLTKLKTDYSNNHKLEDLDDDIYEALNLPYNEWGRCHSLESINITYADSTGIYDVRLNSKLLNENKAAKIKMALIRYRSNSPEYALSDYYLINDEDEENDINELKELTPEELKEKFGEDFDIENEEYCLIELIKDYFSKKSYKYYIK